MVVQRVHVQHASVERSGEWPSVKIITSHTSYVVEILFGGRGAALKLVDDLEGSAVSPGWQQREHHNGQGEAGEAGSDQGELTQP